MLCDECEMEVYQAKRYGKAWICKHCEDTPMETTARLHKKRFLKDYGLVSEARLEMMKRRIISRDDGNTVIDWKTGKESLNY